MKLDLQSSWWKDFLLANRRMDGKRFVTDFWFLIDKTVLHTSHGKHRIQSIQRTTLFQVLWLHAWHHLHNKKHEFFQYQFSNIGKGKIYPRIYSCSRGQIYTYRQKQSGCDTNTSKFMKSSKIRRERLNSIDGNRKRKGLNCHWIQKQIEPFRSQPLKLLPQTDLNDVDFFFGLRDL